MVVVVPSYNNREYFKANLDSILSQNYQNFRIVYVDDFSNDGMSEAIEEYLFERQIDFRSVSFKTDPHESPEQGKDRFSDLLNHSDPFFSLVHNQERYGAMANIYRAVQSVEDESIVLMVDGDDSLSDREVLARVNQAYASHSEVWMTHGTLKEFPSESTAWCEPVPRSIIRRNAFREFKCPSHLRTFYAWLFKKIDVQDFIYQGDFFQATSDMAFMFPICEMAGKRHKFLPEINYNYNMVNNLNDNKVNQQLQNDLDFLIRHKTRYQPLKNDDIPEFMRRS